MSLLCASVSESRFFEVVGDVRFMPNQAPVHYNREPASNWGDKEGDKLMQLFGKLIFE